MLVVVRIQCVFSVSPYHSARGDMQKCLPTKVVQAGQSRQCSGVRAGVIPAVAGVWGAPRVSEEEWGDQGDGTPCGEVQGASCV